MVITMLISLVLLMILIIMSSLSFQFSIKLLIIKPFSIYDYVAFIATSLQGHCPLNILCGYYPILCSLVLHKVQNFFNKFDNTHPFGRCLNSPFVFSFKPFCFHLLVNILQKIYFSLHLNFWLFKI
jgi:hypothetical protein